jgi:hypothetical protein
MNGDISRLGKLWYSILVSEKLGSRPSSFDKSSISFLAFPL